MKTIIKNIINKSVLGIAALSLGAGVVSCSDMLDTKPQGQFTDQQIGEDEAIDFMTAAYATLMNHYFGNNESFAGPINNWVIDLRSDDALKGGDGLGMEGYMHNLEVGNIMSNNDIINFKWRNNYFSISRCNTAINAIRNAGNLSENVKQSYISEMKTLRAYYFYDMLRLFKSFPFYDENETNPSAVVPTSNKAMVAESLKADLREAYDNLPETQPQVGRFNKYVAAAILARIDLFTATPEYTNDVTSVWQEIVTYTNYIIQSGQYSLYPFFQYQSIPQYNNMYESVMAVQFSLANQPDQFNYNNCLNLSYNKYPNPEDPNNKDNMLTLYGDGDDFYLGSQNLIDAFRTDAQGLPYLNETTASDHILGVDYAGNVDPRLDFTFGRIGMWWRAPNTSDQKYMYTEDWCRDLANYSQYSGKKPYPAPYNTDVVINIVPWGASSLNYIIIRYAEVLLMNAEALIEIGGSGLEEARNNINLVRAKSARSINASDVPIDCDPTLARYNCGQYPATNWNQDYARKAVRMERRLELAMEGLRWFDLLRWGTAVETVNNYYQTEQEFESYYAGAYLNANDLYFPIPYQQVNNSNGVYQ